MKILFDSDAIRSGIQTVAGRIRERFAKDELTVLAVLRGGIIFTADLIRALDLPVRLDTIGVSSYRGGATQPGELKIISTPSLEVEGRSVLIVDDILDTGRTLQRIYDDVAARGASTIASCVLLDKPSRRVLPIEADFVVFTVPEVWIVGYGLDHDEKYRNMPYLAAL